MDADLALVIGLIIAVFAIPAVVSALSEGHAPRVAAIAVLIGGGLVAFAVMQKPGGYAMNDLPQVVVGVIGRYIN